MIDGLVDVKRLGARDVDTRNALRTGRLVRLSSRYAAWKDHLEALAPHEARWLRAVVAGRTMPRAVLTGRAAARVQGMWVVTTSKEEVELLLPSGAPPPRQQWPRGCVYVRGKYTPEEIVDAGTFRHTTAIRTAIDIATRHGFREGLVAMDCLLANQHHRRDIVTAIGNLSRTRNIATARRVVKHAVSNSRSPYESYARAVLIGEGYVGVRANARVGPYEADLLCGPLIWEIDGDIKYDGVTYRPTAEMIRYEREREKDLQNMGYIVRRITPSQLLRNEQEFLFLTRLALRGATPPASPDLPPPPR